MHSRDDQNFTVRPPLIAYSSLPLRAKVEEVVSCALTAGVKFTLTPPPIRP
jgi:hypothetical protein